MKKSNYLLAFAMFAFFAFTANAQDKKEEVVTGAIQKETKSRGAAQDENIKVGKRLNSMDGDTESQAIQPKEKGATPRGGVSFCYAYFDNYTSWYIDVYVDGYYEGYLAPYGGGGVYVDSGTTSQYVVAEFDNGARYTWGPSSLNCYNESLVMDVYSDAYDQYTTD